MLGKAWLESCGNSCFCPFHKTCYSCCRRKANLFNIFILDKPILANTHLLCLPYIVCSFFPTNIFSMEISFNQLITTHLHSTPFKIIPCGFDFVIFRPPCLPFVGLMRLHHSEVTFTQPSGCQAEFFCSSPLDNFQIIWIISMSGFAYFWVKTLICIWFQFFQIPASNTFAYSDVAKSKQNGKATKAISQYSLLNLC